MKVRVGHGYDVHRFGEGDAIVLGGVTIPHEQGLIAHSDGDVALHALTDALLGAAALGDIGQHFPDTDSAYAGADSRQLLRGAFKLITDLRFEVSNVDLTIVAQAPKMAPHIPAMRENIASDLGIDVSDVNVKATTTEQLGFTGRKEGIAVYAVALIYKS